MQSGRHAAATIERRLDGDTSARAVPLPRPRDLADDLALPRDRRASARIRRRGLPGWLLWLVVHLVFLTGFKNRVAALAHWTIALLRPRPRRARRSPSSRSSPARRSLDRRAR